MWAMAAVHGVNWVVQHADYGKEARQNMRIAGPATHSFG
jgi:hypothetical protein